MVPTNAEKQARYRKRHLGVDGEKARIQFILDADARVHLGRLARRKGLPGAAVGLAAKPKFSVSARRPRAPSRYDQADQKGNAVPFLSRADVVKASVVRE